MHYTYQGSNCKIEEDLVFIIIESILIRNKRTWTFLPDGFQCSPWPFIVRADIGPLNKINEIDNYNYDSLPIEFLMMSSSKMTKHSDLEINKEYVCMYIFMYVLFLFRFLFLPLYVWSNYYVNIFSLLWKKKKEKRTIQSLYRRSMK
jgi:hypothetical protein